jgi:YHS domain-containing protein
MVELPSVAPLPPGAETRLESDAESNTDRGAEEDPQPLTPADAPLLQIPQPESKPTPPTASLKPAGFVAERATPLDPSDGRAPALDGFCLYELSANERWVEGEPRWSAEFRGEKYLFSSRQHRDRFLADPARYAPAYAGQDPVLVVEAARHIPGKTDYCVNYDGRLYTFSSAVTLARFQRDPERYASGE